MQSLLDLPGGSPAAGRRRIPDAGFRRLQGLSPDFESQHFTHQASVPSHRKQRQLFLTSQSHLRGLKGGKKSGYNLYQSSLSQRNNGLDCFFSVLSLPLVPGWEKPHFKGPLYLPNSLAWGQGGSKKQLTTEAVVN